MISKNQIDSFRFPEATVEERLLLLFPRLLKKERGGTWTGDRLLLPLHRQPIKTKSILFRFLLSSLSLQLLNNNNEKKGGYDGF